MVPYSRVGYFALIIHLFSQSVPTQSYSQTVSNRTSAQSGRFVSELDSRLTIRNIALLPVTDNIDGIYSRPSEERLKYLLSKDHRWNFVESNITAGIKIPSELEEDSEMVRKICESLNVDAVVAARATRGPGGVTFVLDLFLKSDGELLIQETLRDPAQLEIKELQNQIEQMYRRLIDKIPYRALILSRNRQRVTIGIGLRDGLKAGDMLTAVLLVSAKRHPKFRFIVSTEKEVLGRIRIDKVEETLSFGTILSERTLDALQKESKVISEEQITYAGSIDSITPKDELVREDRVAFGDAPQEWMPIAPPTFGKVGLNLGLGSYQYNSNIGSGVGSLSGKSAIFPNLNLVGELWLTPKWTLISEISQGVISISNPRSGSSPATLNVGLSKYTFQAAYSFLLRNEFFGPKVQLSFGYGRYSTQLDNSSPLSLTSTNYSGFILGLTGSLPINSENTWTVGANFDLWLGTTLQESPSSSGSSSESGVNSFSIFATKKLSERINARGAFNFDFFRSSFSGSGSRSESASSSSQLSTVLSAGVEYLF